MRCPNSFNSKLHTERQEGPLWDRRNCHGVEKENKTGQILPCRLAECPMKEDEKLTTKTKEERSILPHKRHWCSLLKILLYSHFANINKASVSPVATGHLVSL